MKIQESGQMYLESIYLLNKKNPNVRAVDIAAFTGYSKPSVSRAMGLLKNAELISVTDAGYISLTKEGIRIAESMYEKHTLLTKFFVTLGVDEEIAAEDACKIEHVISDDSFSALKKYCKKILDF